MNAMAMPIFEESWVDVGAVADLPLQSARRVDTEAGPVAVFRTVGDEVFALADRCPHKGGPLSEGLVHGSAVACPLHDWSICLKTGEPLGADAGKGCVKRHEVRAENGRILLRVSE